MNIDLSNSSNLDSGITEKFSNFRLLGIGKPSAKQVAKYEAKGKTAKIEKLVAKGKIDPNKLSTNSTSADVSTPTPQVGMATTFASQPTRSSEAPTSTSGEVPVNGESSSNKSISPNNSDMILGMPKKDAIMLGGTVVVLILGFFIIKSVIGSAPKTQSIVAA
jgi:hypothetical protein